MAGKSIRTVLFDLDGTLADTAPDLAAALNELLREEGRAPLSFARIRNYVSRGSRALVRLAFGEAVNQETFERLRQRFLAIYRQDLCRHTRLFPGMEEVLDYIESQGLRWAVVTNKPGWLTTPLMDALGLVHKAACVVSGDTTDQVKPHPKPLLHACELIDTRPHHCLYIGDDPRDIEAGKAAGLITLVALYGYIDEDQRPEEWEADGMIETPQQLIDWLARNNAADVAVG